MWNLKTVILHFFPLFYAISCDELGYIAVIKYLLSCHQSYLVN